jgi:hypothetical protein
MKKGLPGLESNAAVFFGRLDDAIFEADLPGIPANVEN